MQYIKKDFKLIVVSLAAICAYAILRPFLNVTFISLYNKFWEEPSFIRDPLRTYFATRNAFTSFFTETVSVVGALLVAWGVNWSLPSAQEKQNPPSPLLKPHPKPIHSRKSLEVPVPLAPTPSPPLSFMSRRPSNADLGTPPGLGTSPLSRRPSNTEDSQQFLQPLRVRSRTGSDPAAASAMPKGTQERLMRAERTSSMGTRAESPPLRARNPHPVASIPLRHSAPRLVTSSAAALGQPESTRVLGVSRGRESPQTGEMGSFPNMQLDLSILNTADSNLLISLSPSRGQLPTSPRPENRSVKSERLTPH